MTISKPFADSVHAASERAPARGQVPVKRQIGFVGLGHMGTAMAANLAADGHRVIAYVRRPNSTLSHSNYCICQEYSV